MTILLWSGLGLRGLNLPGTGLPNDPFGTRRATDLPLSLGRLAVQTKQLSPARKPSAWDSPVAGEDFAWRRELTGRFSFRDPLSAYGFLCSSSFFRHWSASSFLPQPS